MHCGRSAMRVTSIYNIRIMTEENDNFFNTDEEMHAEARKQITAVFDRLSSRGVPPQTIADAAFEVSTEVILADWLIEAAKEWFAGIENTFNRLVAEEQERRKG